MLGIFSTVLLLSLYGLAKITIEGANMISRLSLSFQDVILSIIVLIIMGSLVTGTLVGAILFLITMNISIYVRENDFKITALMYKSEWLTWDRIAKVRNISLHEKKHIVQIGIDGLGWIFKLNGLLFWMYPYGAITVGENNIQNGRELLRIFKQKRPDIFS